MYQDAILVFNGDIQEHNANMKPVLDRLRDVELTLNPKKCRFLQRSVTFLRHTVSSDGMAVTEVRAQQVRTWSTLTNQTELCSFIDLANYYQKAGEEEFQVGGWPHSTTIAPLQPMPTGFTGERVVINIRGPSTTTRRKKPIYSGYGSLLHESS
ncbi:RNA directed DNA polymerase (reverse transcriptase) [Echinococcus multilocularis]|uniref:RNA directed DNA polymerase (Reverse transcriptase) n=1 Tax=Echinococcus multilocularis TaxID=6211 RepID=A0A0S4MN22_ECHMU|nr:RNA directed DNA polymerase (reverse transcriptase) [Echinococcus multilocularis]